MANASVFSGILSILMAFLTMVSSLFGIIQSRPVEELNTNITGFDEKEENAVRIMSFNIRCTNVGTDTWQDRIGIVSQTILAGHPDSLGVQEATPGWMKALKENIGGEYDYVGVGRDNGKNLGEYSAVFYLKDKYDVVDSGTFWLSETPEKPSYGWDAACRRVCSWVILKDRETGREYVHLNSHFDHIGVTARRESVKMIIEKSQQYKDIPAVFTADMNVKEGSENYKQFTESGIFRDAKYDAPDTMSHCTFHATSPETHADDVIDYVMINDGFKALKYRVVTDGVDGRFVSDHYPIYADLEFAE